ncbi:MAG: carbohydrate ABC transporter permease [Saprospiraceae bacterium]|mgnify:CR=1 FL=1|nr:carbohydrate ABC transporter permease [Saprospiraceae bacterium]HRJ15835.1 carbohydrate ABC transporter permease [Saprospiraceae bacterium]HRK80416.1 carbohydrate ABC transporter permease [Saprospiraceae bacterium]
MKAPKLFFYILLAGASLSFLYPFYWMLLATLTPEAQIGALGFLPAGLTMDNYQLLADKIPIGRALLNSFIVAALSTTGVLVFGAMTGYVLAKMRFAGRNLLFFIIIFTMSMPFQLTLIPNYILMVELRWTDTLAALVIPALNSAFAILLFRQAFQSIPDDLIHAARVDGCSELRIIFQILLPNVIPAVITAGIITFMNSWNDVLWPLIVIRNEQLMTMPQLVALFAVGGRSEAQLGVKLAAAVLLALPIIVAYAVFQRHFIQSMASSGLKG